MTRQMMVVKALWVNIDIKAGPTYENEQLVGKPESWKTFNTQHQKILNTAAKENVLQVRKQVYNAGSDVLPECCWRCKPSEMFRKVLKSCTA